MGIFIDAGSGPEYNRSYGVTLAVVAYSDAAREIIHGGEQDGNWVDHDDPILQQALKELDEILGDYEPQDLFPDIDHRFSLDSALATTTSSDGKVTSRIKEHHVLNAAHELREVIKYAVQNESDISVLL